MRFQQCSPPESKGTPLAFRRDCLFRIPASVAQLRRICGGRISFLWPGNRWPGSQRQQGGKSLKDCSWRQKACIRREKAVTYWEGKERAPRRWQTVEDPLARTILRDRTPSHPSRLQNTAANSCIFFQSPQDGCFQPRLAATRNLLPVACL